MRNVGVFGSLMIAWVVGLVGLIPMTLVLQTLFPRLLRRAADNVERGPWSALIVGVLGILVGFLASHVARQASGAGQVIALAVITLLTIGVVFGLAASFRAMGSRIYFSMNSPRADFGFPTTLLGGVVLWLAAILGGVTAVLPGVIGLGACLIAWFGKTASAPVPPRMPQSEASNVPPKIA